MKLAWTDDGWDDYVYWQTEDKRTLKKTNNSRHPGAVIFWKH